MAEAKTVSIHKMTTGGVTEFLDDEEFSCLSSIKFLTYMAGALLRYEEEGVELNPEVMLCESIEAVVRSIPSGKYYVIGESEFSPDLGKKVLKECASLAQSVWAIFIERTSATKVNYGVLSYLATPTSISLRDMITLDRATFAVLVSRVNSTTVRLTGSKGNSLDVAFSTVREPIKGDGDIDKFAGCCVPASLSEPGNRYIRRLLGTLLAESHGTILVCSANDVTTVPGMSDAVRLTPPIDVLNTFEQFRSVGTADSLLELQRIEGLLRGLFQSDGIVVFNDTGQVTAYRVFYRPSVAASTSVAGGTGVSGGARRRAFEGLRTLVGTELISALFRSQDGHTTYVGA